jgi:hypothetical protein
MTFCIADIFNLYSQEFSSQYNSKIHHWIKKQIRHMNTFVMYIFLIDSMLQQKNYLNSQQLQILFSQGELHIDRSVMWRLRIKKCMSIFRAICVVA